MSARNSNLTRAKILVVEDDAIIALEIAATLMDVGYTVLGPVASVTQALALLDADKPDAALLDLRLLDSLATPVAAALRAGAVPFALVTGYVDADLDAVLASAPRLIKPFGSAEVEHIARQLLDQARPIPPRSE